MPNRHRVKANISRVSLPQLVTAEYIGISPSLAYSLNYSFPSLTRADVLKLDGIAR